MVRTPGVEKLFEGRNALGAREAVELAERISGDSSAAHSLAHCLAVEDTLGLDVPNRCTGCAPCWWNWSGFTTT